VGVVVQKFGGSSVANPDKIGDVAEVVCARRKAGDDVVVVVSAMGKTTDELLALARRVSKSKDGASLDPPRRELDMLVSTGERVSMALLAIAIAARGFEAISFTGSQSGIITNDRHFDARIIEVRRHRIEDELARGRVVIVAGYQGMSYRREITTLGRGGSDTTAVALAAALGAEHCEIYSDVDGVYSADPRSVPDARHLPELDYQTMQEMAEVGAKVLNAQAVEWARRQRVVIHARRTSDIARGGGRETVVSEGPLGRGLAVVGERRLARLRVEAGAAGRLLAGARQLELGVRDAALHGEAFVALVPLLSVPDSSRVRESLSALALPGFAWEEGLGAVSLVGVGGGDPGVLARALELGGESLRGVTSGPLRVSVIVPEAAVEEGERAFHREFVERV
jgi:aspartate kinase